MQFLLKHHAIWTRAATNSNAVTWYSVILEMLVDIAMPSRSSEFLAPLDRKTSRSICEAVGERLQRSLPPDGARPSRNLQLLLEELRRHDEMPRHFE